MTIVPTLTARELEVIELVVDGRSNKEIAQRLHLSERTIHSHLGRVMSKTGTHSRTQLAVHALRHGIVPLRAVVEDPGFSSSAD